MRVSGNRAVWIPYEHSVAPLRDCIALPNEATRQRLRGMAGIGDPPRDQMRMSPRRYPA